MSSQCRAIFFLESERGACAALEGGSPACVTLKRSRKRLLTIGIRLRELKRITSVPRRSCRHTHIIYTSYEFDLGVLFESARGKNPRHAPFLRRRAEREALSVFVSFARENFVFNSLDNFCTSLAPFRLDIILGSDLARGFADPKSTVRKINTDVKSFGMAVPKDNKL